MEDDDYLLALEFQKEFFEQGLSDSDDDCVLIEDKENQGAAARPSNSLVSPDWEVTDPNPDIHNLFRVFNSRFFWDKLGSVEVKWSPRMTSCAGICSYRTGGMCTVSLSLPLLKLRPRKDLVETLLHEMIHAFLFVTHNYSDRSDHGPEFHKHMYRINKEAGTNITVYHSFHDEVKFYKTHWWRCEGPCQNRPPFYGYVKRSMNRAPGPNDFWFAEHKSTCGGSFTKIREPEGFKSKKRKPNNEGAGSSKTSKKPGTSVNNNILPKYFSPVTANKAGSSTQTQASNIKRLFDSTTSSDRTPESGGASSTPSTSRVTGFPQLATKGGPKSQGALQSNKGGTLVIKPKTMNNTSKNNDEPKDKALVEHGGGVIPFTGAGHTLAPGKSNDRSRSRLLQMDPSKPKESMLDTVEIIEDEEEDSCGAGRGTAAIPKEHSSGSLSSNLSNQSNQSSSGSLTIDQHPTPSAPPLHQPQPSKPQDPSSIMVACPVCGSRMAQSAMEEHLDSCSNLESVFESPDCVELEDEDSEPDEAFIVQCPCCSFKCTTDEINVHLDQCLNKA